MITGTQAETAIYRLASPLPHPTKLLPMAGESAGNSIELQGVMMLPSVLAMDFLRKLQATASRRELQTFADGCSSFLQP